MAKVRREIEPVKEKKEEKVIALPPARGPALSKLSSVKGMPPELGKLYDDLNLLLEQLNFLQEQNKLLQQQINEFNTNI